MSLLNFFTYGFSIFSMFFGSGNLVFPLKVGVSSGSVWFYGFLGLFISGIFLPLLGLMAVKLNRGHVQTFFNPLGPGLKKTVPFFIISLLGSFGVVPRCITVAHGGIERVFPDVPLMPFSTLFCLVCFLYCLKPHKLIQILGRYLTPLLLGFLGVLMVFVMMDNPNIQTTSASLPQVMTQGFLRGYEPMDLLAAFFFSAFIFKEIEQKSQDLSEKKRFILASSVSLLGIIILGIVYFAFVYLGAAYDPLLQNTAPELLLPSIAYTVMGEKAALMMAIIILLSCLTTAVALSSIYAEHVQGLVPKYLPYRRSLILTLGISFVLSLFDFTGIMAFLGPILDILYPALIGYTLVSLGSWCPDAIKKWIFILLCLGTTPYVLKAINLF